MENTDYVETPDYLPRPETRRKIPIQHIEDNRRRQVTFLKRKNGLMKKAMELGILCDCDVTVLIFNNNNGKLYEFGSVPIEDSLHRYATFSGQVERKANENIINLVASKSTVNIPLQEASLAQAAANAASRASKGFQRQTSADANDLAASHSDTQVEEPEYQELQNPEKVNLEGALSLTPLDESKHEQLPPLASAKISLPPLQDLQSIVDLPDPATLRPLSGRHASRFVPDLATLPPRNHSSNGKLSAFLGLPPTPLVLSEGAEPTWGSLPFPIDHQKATQTPTKQLASPWETLDLPDLGSANGVLRELPNLSKVATSKTPSKGVKRPSDWNPESIRTRNSSEKCLLERHRGITDWIPSAFTKKRTPSKVKYSRSIGGVRGGLSPDCRISPDDRNHKVTARTRIPSLDEGDLIPEDQLFAAWAKPENQTEPDADDSTFVITPPAMPITPFLNMKTSSGGSHVMPSRPFPAVETPLSDETEGAFSLSRRYSIRRSMINSDDEDM